MAQQNDLKTLLSIPGNTLEMLNAAIISENHDSSTMYPEFARVAREEGLDDVAEWFDTLAVAEGIHLRYLSVSLCLCLSVCLSVCLS